MVHTRQAMGEFFAVLETTFLRALFFLLFRYNSTVAVAQKSFKEDNAVTRGEWLFI
jgi:hypothetical protein